MARSSFVSLCLLALVACDTPHLAGPANTTTSKTPHGLRFDLDTIGGFSIPTIANNDSGEVPRLGPGSMNTRSTGIVIPARVIHYLYVGGTVAVTTNTQYSCCFSGVTTYSGDNIGPLGVSDPTYGTEFNLVFGDDGSNPTLYALDPGNISSAAVSDTQANNSTDTLKVLRVGLNGFGGCNSGDTSCVCPGPVYCVSYYAGMYSFSSTQFVKVIVAPLPTFTVTVDNDTVTSGNPATFHISVSPTTWGGQTYYIDYSNSTWTFEGVAQSCYTGCTVYPTATGSMVVQMTVGGNVMVDSATVVVR